MSPLRKHSKPKKFLLATFSPFSISWYSSITAPNLEKWKSHPK